MPRTRRTVRVAAEFGLPLDPSPRTIVARTRVLVGPGRILLLVGPSGGGKTTALRAFRECLPRARSVESGAFPSDAAVIDAVAPNADYETAIHLLSRCALGEAPLWLRRVRELSEGQRFRARLARAIGASLRRRPPAALLCDEYCVTLHRRAARAISYNLRKLASEYGLTLLVACSHEDVIADLRADTILRFAGGGRCTVEVRAPRRRPVSFLRRMVIERGGKRDYDQFASMHYRATDELGFVDKVFVMREGAGGEPLGIVVYAHAPAELSLRNRATEGRFSRNLGRLNRECRILRRLVIHPDVRGCGLGHHLVRRTLPLVGTPFVECLASMGTTNPVFEKAGMTRVGQCSVSPARVRALEQLRRVGADPYSGDFIDDACRRRSVRAVVARAVHAWYQATTAGGASRVARQSPVLLAQLFRNMIATRPVYYLWRRPG